MNSDATNCEFVAMPDEAYLTLLNRINTSATKLAIALDHPDHRVKNNLQQMCAVSIPAICHAEFVYRLRDKLNEDAYLLRFFTALYFDVFSYGVTVDKVNYGFENAVKNIAQGVVMRVRPRPPAANKGFNASHPLSTTVIKPMEGELHELARTFDMELDKFLEFHPELVLLILLAQARFSNPV